jgi:hypothetical protein
VTNLYTLATTLFALLLMAIFLLSIGLRGAIGKKPFLISSRWLTWVVLLSFLLMTAKPFLPPHKLDTSNPLLLLNVVMFIVLAFYFWRLQYGFTAFGITDESFREGLLVSLNRLNLTSEETLSAIRLPTANVDLQVSVQTWVGTAQLRCKQHEKRDLLRNIANEMNGYYDTSAVSINIMSCIFYLIIGVISIATIGVMLFELRGYA